MNRTFAFAWAVVAVAMITGPGCTCSPTNGESSDAGSTDADMHADTAPPPDGAAEASASVDAATDAAEASSSIDAAADAAEASSIDAATDAAEASAACPHHLPVGFTLVEGSQAIEATLTGQGAMRSQSMALDENDDPMFAYVSTNADGSTSAYYVRWDPCAGAFTAPLLVADQPIDGETTDLALAYDPTTKTVGIAFVLPIVWGPNDVISSIALATMQAPATTFTVEALSAGDYGDGGAGAPSIAMQNGQIAVGFWSGPFQETYCGTANVHAACYILYLLTSTTRPGSPIVSDSVPSPVFDGGYTGIVYSGADDGGTNAGPYYFDYHPVPITTAVVGDEGWIDPVYSSGAVSVAFDATGAAGIAGENAIYDTTSNNTEIVYWKPGTESAVIVGAPYAGQNDEVDLVYEGTKPRILARRSNPPPADDLTFFTSDDGVAWSAGVTLSTNGGAQFSGSSSALAFDGNGQWAAVSDLESVNGGAGTPCGSPPLVYTSSDDGATWSMCGADSEDLPYTAGSPSAAFGKSRIAGVIAASFVSSETSQLPDGGVPESAGLYYWQHP